MSGHTYRNGTLTCATCFKEVTFNGCQPANKELPPFVTFPIGVWVGMVVNNDGRLLMVCVCSKDCLEKLPSQTEPATQPTG